MDRGLIGSKERQKTEEPFVAFVAAEGADKQKDGEGFRPLPFFAIAALLFRRSLGKSEFW